MSKEELDCNGCVHEGECDLLCGRQTFFEDLYKPIPPLRARVRGMVRKKPEIGDYSSACFPVMRNEGLKEMDSYYREALPTLEDLKMICKEHEDLPWFCVAEALAKRIEEVIRGGTR